MLIFINKLRNSIEQFASIAIRCLILPLLIFIAWHAIRITVDWGHGNYLDSMSYEISDSLHKNFIFIALFCIFTCVLVYIFKNLKANALKIFAIIALLILDVLLIYYVFNTGIYPCWDEAMVYEAASSFVHNDMSYWGLGEYSITYFSTYQQQFGMIFLEEILLHIWDNYLVMQVFNVILIDVIFITTYFLTKELFSNMFVAIVSVIIAGLSVYLYIYVSYEYGDLFMMASIMLMLYTFIRFYKTKKNIYLIVLTLMAIIGTCVRKNTIIAVIAIGISFVILAFKEKKRLLYLWAILIVTLPLLFNTGIVKLYEYRTGVDFGVAMPAKCWIYEGMLQQPQGNGAWAAVGFSLYNTYFKDDIVGLNEYVDEKINERMLEFKADRNMAYEFYRGKILQQWVEPTYCAFHEVGIGNEMYDYPELVFKIFTGDIYNAILVLLNRLQSLIYLSSIVGILWNFKKSENADYLPLIAIFGGILFSIIWENKGRYVMPFAVLLIPYAGYGLIMLDKTLVSIITKIKAIVF